MASERMIRRERKREELVTKYATRRAALRKELNDPSVPLKRKMEILAEYKKMPKDASKVRKTRRCRLTGRAHAVYRKFGLSRNEVRRRAMQGELPGVVVASW